MGNYVPPYEIKATKKKGHYDLFIHIHESYDRNIEQAMNALAPELAEQVKKNFDELGERGNRERWVTVWNPTPLTDTGKLRESVEGEVQKTGDHHIIVVGTDLPYGKIHNEGGTVETDVIPNFRDYAKAGQLMNNAFPPGPRSPSMWRKGGQVRTKEIPKREWLFITEDDAILSEDIIESALELMREDIEGLE